jgi:tetratricopeptide (TPR) repeat protein
MAHEHDVYCLLADAAAQARDEEALGRFAPAAYELDARDGHRLYQGIAHRALGVAARLHGDHADAETHLGRALDLFQALDARWQAGRTLVELGELALARGESGTAQEYYQQALSAYEKLRALPDAERTRIRLNELVST